MPTHSIRRRPLLALLLLVGVLACGGGGDPAALENPPGGPGTPSGPGGTPNGGTPNGGTPTLAVVAGAGQSASVGAELAGPVRVAVRDALGRAAIGVAVDWTVAKGGGTLSVTRSLTDSSGHAGTSWTLGLDAGEQAVLAAAPGAAPVTVAATAVADTSKPVLTGFSLSTREVRIDQTSASLDMRFSVTDAGAGVSAVSATYAGPAGVQSAICAVGSRLVDGTPRDGSWLCTAQFTKFAANGEWGIREVLLHDRAGNERRYPAAELQAAEMPTTFAVINVASDVAKPVLAALSFSLASVDVSSGDQVVRVTTRLRDDVAGVRSMQIDLRAPGQAGQQGQLAGCTAFTLASGTALDGTWTCDLTLKRDAAAGAWEVALVAATDNANNFMQLASPTLRELGLPASLTVVSPNEDVATPTLTGLTVSPATLNLSGGDQFVDFTLTATDDRTGIAFVRAFLRPPGGTGLSGCSSQTPASGTATSGTFRCRFLVNQFGADGAWSIVVYLEDGVRNIRTYTTADLSTLGFPSTVTVTHGP